MTLLTVTLRRARRTHRSEGTGVRTHRRWGTGDIAGVWRATFLRYCTFSIHNQHLIIRIELAVEAPLQAPLQGPLQVEMLFGFPLQALVQALVQALLQSLLQAAPWGAAATAACSPG